jgi:hypothetical protein
VSARRAAPRFRAPKFKFNPKAAILALALVGLVFFLLKDFVIEKGDRLPHDLSRYPVPSPRVAVATSVPVFEVPKPLPAPPPAQKPAPKPVALPEAKAPIILKVKPVGPKEIEKEEPPRIEVKKAEPAKKIEVKKEVPKKEPAKKEVPKKEPAKKAEVKKEPKPLFKPSKALETIKKLVAPKKAVKPAEKPKAIQAPKPRPAAPKPEPAKPAVVRPAEPPPPPAKPAAGKIAIILDDWGNNYYALKYLYEIDRPITLAVIPDLPHSRRIAEEAHARRFGIMLHMPMEPESASQPLEPQTIRTSTSDWLIRKYLQEALADIPHVEGVNNHMGSKATSDLRVMREVLGYLKQRGLFFVDSNTSSKTVAPRVARELGIRFAKRQVFLDNELNTLAIKRQLIEAKERALKYGEVVVIGHDKKTTLEAIRDMVPEIEKDGVRFVLAKDLVRRQ